MANFLLLQPPAINNHSLYSIVLVKLLFVFSLLIGPWVLYKGLAKELAPTWKYQVSQYLHNTWQMHTKQWHCPHALNRLVLRYWMQLLHMVFQASHWWSLSHSTNSEILVFIFLLTAFFTPANSACRPPQGDLYSHNHPCLFFGVWLSP